MCLESGILISKMTLRLLVDSFVVSWLDRKKKKALLASMHTTGCKIHFTESI